MNDLYIINGAKTLIYGVCLYDLKKSQIILFQVSSIANNIKYIINIEVTNFKL